MRGIRLQFCAPDPAASRRFSIRLSSKSRSWWLSTCPDEAQKIRAGGFYMPVSPRNLQALVQPSFTATSTQLRQGYFGDLAVKACLAVYCGGRDEHPPDLGGHRISGPPSAAGTC